MRLIGLAVAVFLAFTFASLFVQWPRTSVIVSTGVALWAVTVAFLVRAFMLLTRKPPHVRS